MNDYLNKKIGQKIRARRKQLGFNQEDIGKSLGIGFQQLHKYETGKSRIDVAKLIEIASFLKVPSSYFLDDSIDDRERVIDDGREIVIIRCLEKVKNEQMREAIVSLCKNISKIKVLTIS